MKTIDIETEIIPSVVKPESEAPSPAEPANVTNETEGAGVNAPAVESAEQLLPVTGDAFVMIDLSKLQPHPFNVTVYGEETPDEAFLRNVEQQGIYTPLMATTTGKLISGHRRYAAAVKLNLPQVPVIIRKFPDELAEKEAVIDANRQRKKDNVQESREFKAIWDIEAERGRERMATNETGKPGRKKFAQAESGKARDKAAEAFGKSGVTLSKGAQVVDQIDALREKGKNEKAAELEAALLKSFDGGYNKAVAMKLIKVPGSATPPKRTSTKGATTESPFSAGSSETTDPVGGKTEASGDETEEKAPPAAAEETEHKRAVEHAIALVTYINKTPAKKLDDGQKNHWEGVLGPVIKWFKALGA